MPPGVVIAVVAAVVVVVLLLLALVAWSVGRARKQPASATISLHNPGFEPTGVPAAQHTKEHRRRSSPDPYSVPVKHGPLSAGFISTGAAYTSQITSVPTAVVFGDAEV